MLPVLIMHLGIDGYGIYMQIILIGSVLSIFTTSGMNISIVRYYHLNNYEISICLGVIIITSVIVGSFWFLTGTWLIRIFKLPLETLFLAFFISVLVSLKSIFFGYYRASEQYSKILSCFTTFEIIEVFVVGGLGFTNISIDIVKIILIILFIRIFPISIAFIDIKPKLLIKKKQLIVWQRIKFGVSIIPKDLFLWLGHSADRFVISYIMGPASVGIYASIYKIASIVKFLSQPVTFTEFPGLAKAWDSGDLQIFNRKKWESAGLYLLISIPVLLLFIIMPAKILSLISKELTNTKVLLILISLGLIIHSVQVLTGYYVYVFSNKVWRYSVIISTSNCIGLIFQYYLLITWDLTGAAFGSLIIYFFLWLIVLIDSSTFYKKKILCPNHIEHSQV